MKKIIYYHILKCNSRTTHFFGRHVQLSGLHKTNLEAIRSGKGSSNGAGDTVDEDSQQYRDRALERRKKYGMPNKPPPNKLKVRYS